MAAQGGIGAGEGRPGQGGMVAGAGAGGRLRLDCGMINNQSVLNGFINLIQRCAALSIKACNTMYAMPGSWICRLLQLLWQPQSAAAAAPKPSRGKPSRAEPSLDVLAVSLTSFRHFMSCCCVRNCRCQCPGPRPGMLSSCLLLALFLLSALAPSVSLTVIVSCRNVSCNHS